MSQIESRELTVEKGNFIPTRGNNSTGSATEMFSETSSETFT